MIRKPRCQLLGFLIVVCTRWPALLSGSPTFSRTYMAAARAVCATASAQLPQIQPFIRRPFQAAVIEIESVDLDTHPRHGPEALHPFLIHFGVSLELRTRSQTLTGVAPKGHTELEVIPPVPSGSGSETGRKAGLSASGAICPLIRTCRPSATIEEPREHGKAQTSHTRPHQPERCQTRQALSFLRHLNTRRKGQRDQEHRL